MVFPVVGGTQDTGAYEISNSLRFNDDDSPRLARAQANGNQDKWTWSGWVKRSTLGAAQCFFATTDGSATSFDAKFDSSNRIEVYNYFGGGFDSKLVTNRLFRDVSAWYHIVIVYDSGNSTESNRLRIYVNGTEESSFSTTNYPSLNADSDLNVSGSNIEIGRQANGSQFFDGYMAEIFLLDGQAKAPTDFAETDDNGVWIPKDVKDDLTFGTNGFYMEFKQTGTSANSSGIGADTSGNDNHMSVTNLAATDVTEDTPTNNFATWNPLHKASNVTLTEGNCKAAIAGAGQSRSTTSTIAVSKGKWYFEIKYTSDNVSGFIGLISADIGWNINTTTYPSSGVSDNVGFNDGGTKYVNGSSSSYGSGFGNNDIIGVAANLDDGEVVFYVNGTAENSGTPISKTFSGDNFFVVQHQSSNGTSNFEVNFGNPTFSISSGNADANGYGNFEYAPPSGYYAVCTKNLAEFG